MHNKPATTEVKSGSLKSGCHQRVFSKEMDPIKVLKGDMTLHRWMDGWIDGWMDGMGWDGMDSRLGK